MATAWKCGHYVEKTPDGAIPDQCAYCLREGALRFLSGERKPSNQLLRIVAQLGKLLAATKSKEE